MSYGFWEPILVFTMVNCIVALGLYVTLMSGLLSNSHAALLGMGAYTSAILTTNFHWPFVPAIIIAIIVGSSAGAVTALVTKRMSHFTLALATLGLSETLSVTAYSIEYIGGANSFSGIPLRTNLPIAVAGLLLVVYVVWRFEGSREGFAARAVRDNPRAAAAHGINVLWIRVLTYGLGGGIAGFAGALSAHYTLVVNPGDLAFYQSFTLLIYVIFGGSYTMWGALLGASLLTILPQLLRFAAAYRFALYGLIIVCMVIWRSQGLIGRIPTSDEPTGLTRLLGRIRASVAGD